MGAKTKNREIAFVFFLLILLVPVTFGEESLIQQASRLQREGQPDSALTVFREALSLPAVSPAQKLSCLNGIADNLVSLGRWDTAAAVLDEARRIGEGTGEGLEVGLSQTYATLALVIAFRETDASEAITYARRACEIRERRFGENSINTARSLYILGYTYKKAGRFDSAIVYLYRALRVQEQHTPHTDRECTSTLALLGSALENTGRLGEAVRIHRECLEKLEHLGMGGSPGAMAAHSYLSTNLQSLGEVREALDHAEKSLALSTRLYGADALFTSGRYAQLGELYLELGDFERAFEFCEHSLSIADSPGATPPSWVASICRTLSQTERKRDRPARALPYVTRGLEISRTLDSVALPETALLLDEAALVYADLGDNATALKYCRESLKVKRSLSGDRPTVDIAAGHLRMAEIFHRSGPPDSASAHAAESSRMLGSCADKNSLLEGRIWAMKGEIESSARRPLRAVDRYQNAIGAVVPDLRGSSYERNPTGAGVETGEFLVEVLTAKAFALRQLAAGSDNVDDRAAYGRAALVSLDCAAAIAAKMQRSFAMDESKLSLRERTASLYRAGVESGAALYETTGDRTYAEWAFRFAERSKSGILAENLERIRTSVPDSLRERQRHTLAGIHACELSIDKAGRRSTGEQSARLFTLRQELERLEALIERPVEGSNTPAGLDVTALQAALPEDVAIVEFAKTDGNLRIFVVRADTFLMCSGPPSARTGDRVRSLRRSIKTLDWTAYLADAGALHEDLIAPVQHLLRPGKRLVIIPDEELALLPFEVLIPRNTARKPGPTDFASLPYLVKSHEISYAPSAALYCRESPSHEAGHPRSFAGFAPVFRDEKTGLIAALRSINVDGKEYGELKYSEDEVRSILASFRGSGSEGVAFINESATKEEVLSALGSFTHVHIATHGFANDSLPGLSGLVLSSPGGTPEILYARETYGLRSNADLLVLSACETGLGRIARGEGVLALTRGFLSAGIHNVVYSLWRVMDRPSSELMKSFYRNMSPGSRYEEALRKSKLEMIRSSATAFPYHWAGFVLVHGQGKE